MGDKKCNMDIKFESPINKEFIIKKMGERIFNLRKQQHLTQEQLAENAGVSHQFFSVLNAVKKIYVL